LAKEAEQSGLFTVELVADNAEIQSEVDILKKTLHDNFLEISSKTHKPNILLLGGSGAGKSSLVNAVFGKPLAEIGEGKPITQQYTKFSGSDSPVVIYDSKGIEHGYVETGFIADTKKFFKKLRGEPELEKHVHVVWYVIDLTQARFQPFEAQFCREQLRDIPIIFVLNKADAVSDEVRDIMIKVIADHNLSNCIGIYATVANCKNFDSKSCPSCNSPKIRKRIKAGTCTIMCKECKYNTTMDKTAGIESLSRATLSVMPDLVKEVYIVSQRSHVLGQEAEAKKIIISYASDASLTKSERLSEQLVQMTKKLVQLYQMPTVSDVMERAVKERYEIFYSEQKITRKAYYFFNDLFSKKYTMAQAFVVAAGLEVCSSVINFKNAAIQQAIRSFEDHVKNEEEEEAADDAQPESPQQENGTVTTTPTQQEIKGKGVAAMEKSLKSSYEEHDIEWFLHKLVANMHLELDSAMVTIISEEVRKFQSVARYLNHIAIDGKRVYTTPDWEEIIRSRREQDEQDRKDMQIPLYTYQKAGEQQQPSQQPQQQQPSSSQENQI
jgi:predicted GTPase